MAFAKLIFSNTVTVQQKLKEIANICTGGITSNSQLQFADTANSVIITTEPAGWTIADANSALETGSTATKVQYRLSAPCVDTSKTKYCELSALASDNLPANQDLRNTRPGASATTGFLWIPIGSGVSANNLTNQVWYYNRGTNIGSGFNLICNFNVRLSTSTTEYYVSVTNRKLIVFCSTNSNGPAIIMNLEFPETDHTIRWSNLPFININLNNSPQAPSPHGTINENWFAGTQANVHTASFRAIWLTNWYDITAGARAQRSAEIFFVPYYMVNAPSLTVNAAGTSIYPLLPFVDVRTSRMEGIHNYSTLTDTFYTYRTSTYTAIGDEITVGSDTYVVLTIGSSTTYNRCICIKKA